MQPLMAVDGQVVCFFVCSHEDTNLNFVIFVGSQERREWISRLYPFGQSRIESWLNIELSIGAGDVRFVNLRQITSGGACLRVRRRIANAQRHRLVAIVNAHGALVRGGDCLRTW